MFRTRWCYLEMDLSCHNHSQNKELKPHKTLKQINEEQKTFECA